MLFLLTHYYSPWSRFYSFYYFFSGGGGCWVWVWQLLRSVSRILHFVVDNE